ncbi:MAG: uncharacterized protein KVP18_001505 [Porospora cf. gigantea A]|uniref:uncharacterized protein n=1 Tax=Porospora cf. gigantea A TaxID=2853593 RepID=UPI003559CE3D|nr:MAG: hypothetical protein KVP18_001505 [Porospora cf. gigantea A]
MRIQAIGLSLLGISLLVLLRFLIRSTPESHDQVDVGMLCATDSCLRSALVDGRLNDIPYLPRYTPVSLRPEDLDAFDLFQSPIDTVWPDNDEAVQPKPLHPRFVVARLISNSLPPWTAPASVRHNLQRILEYEATTKHMDIISKKLVVERLFFVDRIVNTTEANAIEALLRLNPDVYRIHHPVNFNFLSWVPDRPSYLLNNNHGMKWLAEEGAAMGGLYTMLLDDQMILHKSTLESLARVIGQQKSTKEFMLVPVLRMTSGKLISALTADIPALLDQTVVDMPALVLRYTATHSVFDEAGPSGGSNSFFYTTNADRVAWILQHKKTKTLCTEIVSHLAARPLSELTNRGVNATKATTSREC